MGSLDVEALYPGLEVEEVSKICADMVTESGLKFEGFDLVWACKYVALTWERERIAKEKIGGLIPKRIATQGNIHHL